MSKVFEITGLGEIDPDRRRSVVATPTGGRAGWRAGRARDPGPTRLPEPRPAGRRPPRVASSRRSATSASTTCGWPCRRRPPTPSIAHADLSSDERIVIRCNLADDRIEVEVIDVGGGFDPTSVVGPPGGRAPRPAPVGARVGPAAHPISPTRRRSGRPRVAPRCAWSSTSRSRRHHLPTPDPVGGGQESVIWVENAPTWRSARTASNPPDRLNTDADEQSPPSPSARHLPRQRPAARSQRSGGRWRASCASKLPAASSCWSPRSSRWSGPTSARHGYEEFWTTEARIRPRRLRARADAARWVNDGLMALFFFVVGLEIKRELVAGELRDPRAAALPVIAALGGMVVPALHLHRVQRRGRRRRAGGASRWPPTSPSPSASSPARASGSRRSLKVFLLTLADRRRHRRHRRDRRLLHRRPAPRLAGRRRRGAAVMVAAAVGPRSGTTPLYVVLGIARLVLRARSRRARHDRRRGARAC